MESRAIAAVLEKEFPSPPLYLDSPILPKVEALMPKIMLHLPPVYLPRVPRDGPFFMGQTVSYAGFILVGFLQFLKRLSHDNDLFNRVVQVDQSFLVLYEACAEWLKRDDY
jgi:glutathione S-transferase